MSGAVTLASPQLISMSEIAELARVRRPVVTTWRRRHSDFPAPVGDDRGQPLFEARRVVDWLVDTGRAERAEIEPDLRLHLLGDLLTGTVTSARRTSPARRRPAGLTPRETVAAITALICLRHLDDEPLCPDGHADRHVLADLRDRAADVDPEDELLRAEVDRLPDDAWWLPMAVDELVEAAWDCRRAFERVLAAKHRIAVPDLYVDAVVPALARLIAGLSGAREHADRFGSVRIADPMAGTGDLLLHVLDQLGEEHTASIIAAEADPFRARVARRRLAVRDITEAGRVHLDPALPSAGLPPDVLITHLPFQPQEARKTVDSLADLRDFADRLAPGQTAVVLGPADLLVGGLPPYHPASRTRNELLAAGRVEAVIQLPGGLVPFRPGYQTALWVLRHETSSQRREASSPWHGRVLLADVAGQPLTPELADTLIWDVVTWRRDGHRPDQHLRAHARQVAVADLLATPRRPLTTRAPSPLRESIGDPRRTIARVWELEADLTAISDADVTTRPTVRSGLATRSTARPAPTQSIGTLVRSGLLLAGKGARVNPADLSVDGHHALLGAPELTGGTPTDRRRLDRRVLAERYPQLRLTEPGDVVVTLTPRPAVHLDQAGFSVVEFPARLLRITATGRERFTPRVLAVLLTASQAGRATGAVRCAARLDQIQLPVLPPEEVARLDALLAVAEQRRAVARRELDLLDELCRVAVSGLTDGKLTITEAPTGG